MIAELIPASFSHVVLVTGSRSWSDEKSMRKTFNDAWRDWGAKNVTRPLLISGHCHEGDGSEQGGAGIQRNQEMVDAAQVYRDAGVQVLCTAFLDLCRKPGCPKRRHEQLMPHTPGHFSHGTIHCRSRARAAGIETADVVHPSLPPF